MILREEGAEHGVGYLTTQKYSSQPHAMSLLPVIGPLGSGIMYCSGMYTGLSIIYPIFNLNIIRRRA